MHRFYCANLSEGLRQICVNDPDEVHHLARVLRLSAGDDIELLNGRGGLALAKIQHVSKTDVATEILRYCEAPLDSHAPIVLACALPKRSKFDDIIEKCTELGVDQIIPLITERTEVSPSQDALSRMNARFNKIAQSGSKQCKRLRFPLIHQALSLQAAVDLFAVERNTLLIPWLEGERRSLKEAWQASGVGGNKGAIVFFIGPEGDFTPEEAAYACCKGAIPVSLGDTILRVETAAIAVTSFARFIQLRS